MEKDDDKMKAAQAEFDKQMEAQRIASIVSNTVIWRVRMDTLNMLLLALAVGWVFWMGRVHAQGQEAAA